MRQKLFSMLALLMMAVTGAWAQSQQWKSGDCTVTFSEGVMTVSGTGAMEDYLDYNFIPWDIYRYDTETIVIESGVTSIGNNAFARFTYLKSVSIPASVTSIGEAAFEECGYEATTAVTVSFAEGSTPLTIGKDAFQYANLKSIDIPNRVTSIGEGAFTNCRNLESVSIPASVTSIGRYAFQNCGSDAAALTVSIAEGSTPLTIGNNAFYESNLTSIDIPNRVTSIGNSAFTNCSNLESVSIPASVTDIYEGAFSWCSKLAKVYIFATSLTTYGNMAFDYNAAGRKIYVLPTAVDTYKAGWSAYSADIEAMPGYTVTLAEGTEDADKWTVSPNPAEEGQTVTITYAGTKSVKSVTAKRKTTTGNITVYFTDAQDYGDVHVYYWNDGPEWPGIAMTYVETNGLGQNIYRAEIPATAEGIIFNGNGSQTGDIKENIADGSWWYATDNSEVAYNDKYTKNIEVTNVDDNKWTFTMTASDVELQVEYYATTPFDLTLATGSDAHGTVAFTVGGNAATQAKKDDVVTVSVTPNEGFSAKDVTVRAYTSWEAASDILTGGGNNPELVSDINVTKNETDGTWQFTMPEANVWVVVTYAKNLQDAWIQNIDNQTYTGSAIEPTVTVKDGETALVLNTDYTVAYTNNTEVGEATVTVTGMGNYSGTATANFTIVADKTELNSAITEAETYYNSISTLFPEVAATLQTAINAAKGVKDNTEATQEQIEAAIAALASAKTTAEQAGSEGLYVVMGAIGEAETYYNSIKDSYPTIAGDMENEIMTIWDAVITGSYNSTAENAIAEINAAVNAAKAKIASIVAITIPAKSYVARIDADKRQIETAVAGVGLYSVKSVTNTEVELTAELSVIAAEMPYFIYNAGDTEVEVNIVVSSEDADNVDYDSDHFKGTLVDKTFTGEDMEEADHYVLSGGSFVWVKDAGTLSAGKCWIQLEKSPANARALSIVHEGETTGISTVKTAADTKDAAVYDLQGRRVNKPAKGLFIVNGKKVVIK